MSHPNAIYFPEPTHPDAPMSHSNPVAAPNHAQRKDGRSYQRSDFKETQREYFTDLLGRKWDCDIPGHTVCVPTEDGQHYRISDENLAVWVDALCLGEATTAQPPEGILTSDRDNAPSTRADGSVRAVSIPPSRRRNIRSPALAATASLRETLEKSSISGGSSGVPGPGYYSGKALKWLGERSLSALEDVIVLKRIYRYRYRLKRWEKLKGTLGMKQQKKLFKMLEDALEMSRPCYSFRVNRGGALIGDKVRTWGNGHGWIEEDASYLCPLYTCLAPLRDPVILAEFDSYTDDLAWELLNTITRVPLALQDSEATSSVIRILARELAYSPYVSNHPGVGRNLLDILYLTLRMRDLTPEEMSAIHAMAARRLEKNGDEDYWTCRPWEVTIFADCATQDPWFKEVVLGSHGLQSLLSAQDVILSKGLTDKDGEWFLLDGLIGAVWQLSFHPWVAKAVEPRTIHMLLNAFRQRTPDPWFRIRCRAIHSIQIIISHQPALLHTLIQENTAPAFASFTSAPIPRGATGGDRHRKNLAIDAAESLLRQMEELSTQSDSVSDE